MQTFCRATIIILLLWQFLVSCSKDAINETRGPEYVFGCFIANILWYGAGLLLMIGAGTFK